MEDKKPRRNGILIALIVVAVLLVLLGAMQYSRKHDLPAAQRLGEWFARGSSDAAEATPDAAMDASGGDATAEPEVDLYDNVGEIDSYEGYLQDTLVPEFGLASQAAVAAAQSAGYTFAADADKAGATGILSAQVIDLDNDTENELVLLLIREDNGGYPLEMRVYGMQDGKFAPRSETPVMITDMARHTATLTDSVEIVSRDQNCYLLYHQYVEGMATFYDRYIAYDITAKNPQQVLDGVYAYYGGAVLIASVVPPWLDESELSEAPVITDVMSGLSGTGLYADTIQEAPYEGGTASYSAYTELYEDSITALNAMLGPLADANRMTLLDPLSRDWTGLLTLFSDDADTDAAEGEPVDGEAEGAEYGVEFDEALDGYLPPPDYVELETPDDP